MEYQGDHAQTLTPTICKDLSSISSLLGLWKSSWSHSGPVSQGIRQQNILTHPIIGLLSWCFLQAYFTPLPSQAAAQACHSQIIKTGSVSIFLPHSKLKLPLMEPNQIPSLFLRQDFPLQYKLTSILWPSLPWDLAMVIDVYHTLAPNKISFKAFIAPSPSLCHCPGTWFKQVLNNIEVKAEFFSLIKHWVWETLKLFHTKSI